MKKRFTSMLVIVLLVLALSPTTIAAGMLDTHAEPVVIASSGSFEANYKTRLTFNLSGGNLTSAKWSLVYLAAGYSLKGTIKEGETFSLSVTGTQAPIGDLLVFNQLKMDLVFRDTNNNNIGEVQKYNSDYVKTSPISHQLGGTVPEGTKRVLLSGNFVCRWAGMSVVQEGVSINVEFTVEDKPEVVAPVVTVTPRVTQSERPVETTPKTTTNPSPTSAQLKPSALNEGNQKPTPDDELPWDSDSPWEHAGVGATLVISLVSALAAIFGGAIGSAAGGAAAGVAAGVFGGTESTVGASDVDQNQNEGDADSGQDPAYEQKSVPDYPEFKIGEDGEHISKMQNGTIEVSYPSGERAVHFLNGTVQIRKPDGSTWEEWPDGTVTSSDDEGQYTKTPDGTLSHVKPNGEETTYHPDGTSTETKQNGTKITRNESNEVTKMVDKRGNVGVRHPEEPDAFLVTSPHGGSLTYRTKQQWVQRQTEDGRIENELVDHMTIEGEIRTENMSLTFKPDGTMEGQGDDGSRISKDSKDNWKAQTADGDTYERHADGRENYQGADGTSYRVDPNTGEVEARLPDGSFVKRDAQGNSSFEDKKSGLRSETQNDGSKKYETDDASLAQKADGTQEFVTKTGVQVTQKPDGTVTTRLPDGRMSLDTPDGSKTVKMPDGTTFNKSADGVTHIQHPDGRVQRTTQQDYEREMARYNDWYNKHLEQWLKKQG